MTLRLSRAKLDDLYAITFCGSFTASSRENNKARSQRLARRKIYEKLF